MKKHVSDLLNIGAALSMLHMGSASYIRHTSDTTTRFEPVSPIVAPSAEIPVELKDLIATKYYVPIRGLATEGTHTGETYGRSKSAYANWVDGSPLQFYVTGEYTPGSGVVVPFISFNMDGVVHTIPIMFPGSVPLGLSLNPKDVELSIQQADVSDYRRAGIADPRLGFDKPLFDYRISDRATGFECGSLLGVYYDSQGNPVATIVGGLQQGNHTGNQPS